MIKKLFSLFAVITLLTLICVSCKSNRARPDSGAASGQTQPSSGPGTTPGQTTPSSGPGTTPDQTTPSSGSGTTPGQTTPSSGAGTTSGQPIPAAVQNSIAKVEEARKRALDFESPVHLPNEWASTEAQYAAAGRAPMSSAGEIQQAVALYDATAQAYDELYRKTIPLYAKAKEDEIVSARDKLINTGLADFFPEYLQGADEIALAAQDQYEAGDYYKAKDTAAQALNEYEDLLIGANIVLARQEIVDHGFVVYDPDSFERANEIALTAKDQYDAGNKEDAVAKAKEALLQYNTVLEKGWTAYAGEQQSLAASERELAIAEKANVATRDTFNGADALYNRAQRHFLSRDFKNAANSYIESKELFTVARNDTEEKRLRATEAMRLADEKIEESVESALEADRVIEGGLI